MHLPNSIYPMRKIQPMLALVIIPLLLVLSPGANASHNLNTDFQGTMVEGYDVVAYYTVADAVKGSEDISVDWLGGKWFFANNEHRDLFLADPAKYVPQYGGYCASASVSGDHSFINPQSWRIVDNKLYLFAGNGAARRWLLKDASLIAEADKVWEKVKAGLLQQ